MKSFALIVLSVALAVGGTASAQETGWRIGEIVVSAGRTHFAADRIPANVSVLSKSDIDEARHANLVEVLSTLDGVYFRTTSGDATQAQISMRGFGENSHGRVLVLLDGRKLNHPDMSGINWSQIPLNNVERIEVIRGSQSALYGDYALGGVVNIVTIKGTPTPEHSISAIAGSHGLNIQRLGATGASGPVSYAAHAERNQSSGYRDRSAYLTWGGGLNLGYDLNKWNNASLALSYNIIDYELPGYLTWDQMKEDPRQSVFPNDSAERTVYNADLGFKSLLHDACRFDMNVSYSRKDMVSDMTSWAGFMDSAIDTYGATPRFTFETHLFDRDNVFLVGFDGYQDNLDAERYSDLDRSIETASAKIGRRTLGGYAKNELTIFDPLILDLGGRMDHGRFDADVPSSGIDETKSYNANALSAGLIYLFADDAKLFTRAGTVYRFPFVDELISYSGYVDEMYTDLGIEKGRNYETGAELMVFENIRAGVTLFLLDMKDQIQWNAVTLRNENLDDIRHMGTEAKAGWAFRDICRLDAWYTFVQARFSDGKFKGNDAPLAPNHKVSLAANWFLPFDLSLNAVLTYVGEQHLGGDEANTGNKLSDYAVVDVGLHYAPETSTWPELKAFVGIDNVFGEKYATAGYQGWQDDVYYPSAERSFKAGVSCRF